jgi:hypothetical protein
VFMQMPHSAGFRKDGTGLLEVPAACQSNGFIFYSILLLLEVHAHIGDKR